MALIPLILLALRSELDSQTIFIKKEVLLGAYLKNDIGDEIVNSNFSASDAIAKQHNLNSRQTTILKYLNHSLKITIQNCEAMFPDVSRRTLQRDLKAMQEKQLLLPQGNTDRRSYYFNLDLTSDN